MLLNGAEHELPAGATLAELVESLELRRDQVAVEVNRALVRRERYDETALAQGDEIEVVTLVGGG